MAIPHLRFQFHFDIIKPDARLAEPQPASLAAPSVAPVTASIVDPSAAPVAAPVALAAPAKPPRLLPTMRGVLLFAAGLLLGWLLIGWWLWPVQWVNSAPWHLQPQFQRTYVSLASENFARTSDVAQLEQVFSGWKREDLSQLLGAMQNETSDTAARQRLSTMATALRTTVPNVAAQGNPLFGQPLVVGSALITVLLLLSAALVVVLPRLKKQQAAQSQQPQTVTALAAPQDSIAAVAAQPSPANVQSQPAATTAPATAAQSGSTPTVAPADAQANAPAQPPAAQAAPAATGQPAAPNTGNPTAAPISDPNAKKPDAPTVANNAQNAAKPEENKPAAPPQTEMQKRTQAAAEAAQKQNEADKEADAKSGSKTSGLLSLFDDEETGLSALEALCRTLPDIDLEELRSDLKEALTTLRSSLPNDRTSATDLPEDVRR